MDKGGGSGSEILSRESFLGSGWEAAAAAASAPDCDSYGPQFSSLVVDLSKAGEYEKAAAVRAVARACQLGLEPDDDLGPFVPIFRMGASRSIALEDLTESELDFYATLLETLDDPVLIARLGDILWCRRHDGKAAARAAQAYREVVKVAIDAGRTVRARKEMRRMLDLSALLGRKNQPFCDAVEMLSVAVEASGDESSRNACLDIVRALLHHRAGDMVNLGAALQQWADDAMRQKDWLWAQHWWQLAIRCAELRNDREALAQLRRRAAAAFEMQAEALARTPGQAGAAAHWLQAAIATLQAVKDTQQEREALTQRLRVIQETAVSEFGRVSHEVDLTGHIQDAISSVTQTVLRDALVRLSMIRSPRRRALLEEETRALIHESPISILIPRQIIDERGRVIATSGALTFGEGQDEAFRDRVVSTAVMYQRLSSPVIDRARMVIEEQHAVTIDEFRFLAHCSPFVPSGREDSFARGLYQGMRGEYVDAVHRLLPQLEHALRMLLRRAGVETLTQDRDGVQKERNLNQLLEMPELGQLLGDDLVFDLQVLLVDAFGSNFRHDVAHGLRSDAALDSWEAAYCWWTILRICVLFALPASKIDQETQESDPTQPDGGGQGCQD